MQCANSSGFRNVFPNELFGIKNLMDCSLPPNREEGACLEKALRDCMQNALKRGIPLQKMTSMGRDNRRRRSFKTGRACPQKRGQV